MRKLLLLLTIVGCLVQLKAQTLAGYPITDYLVTAIHPNGCADNYVTGPPEDSIWVNLDTNDVMTGMFGSSWSNTAGTELLLETGYHEDNYRVRLLLSTGLYSSPHNVAVGDWTQIPSIQWVHLFPGCNDGSLMDDRYVLPLDFATHFGLGPSDIVTGIEITFLATIGAPDLAGVYITVPCPSVNLGADTVICQGQSITLDVSAPGAAYLWHDNSTNPTYTVTQPGTYWVFRMDSCGITSDTIVVGVGSPPTVTLGNDTTLCAGQSLNLNPSTSNVTYQWSDGSTGSSLLVTQAGSYALTVTNGCGTDADTINVSYYPETQLELGNDTTLCSGQSLLLDASNPGASYLWQDGSTNSDYMVTQAGLYWVEVTDSCGTISDTIEVFYDAIPTANLGPDTTLCAGQVLNLDVTYPNATYQWQDGSSQATYSITQSGSYAVTVSNNCGSSIDTIDVQYIPLPTVNIGNDTTICEGYTVYLDATTPNATYMWQDGSTGSNYTASQGGTFWVDVSTVCGTVRDSLRLTVDECDCILYFPTGFSPNNDGANDSFRPQVACNLTEYHLSIFSRWGSMLFETDNPLEAWDGTYEGNPLPMGVYVYIVVYGSAEVENVLQHGNVTLLR